MKKLYVLDTNVLLSDPTSIYAFDDNDLIIPMAVLEELDHHKKRMDEVGNNARQVSRTLDSMRGNGNSFITGITLPGGGKLTVNSIQSDVMALLPTELQSDKVDNLIIAFMLHLKTFPEAQEIETILVSKDINVRLKCDSLGIHCQDYLRMRVADSADKLYRGVDVFELDTPEIVNEFYATGRLEIENGEFGGRQIYPNQIIVLKYVEGEYTVKSAMSRYVSQQKALLPITNIDNVFGIKPRNKEQRFALDLLLDDNIKLVTLSGIAGVGKNLLSLAAGLMQLRNFNSNVGAKYDKMILTKLIQPVGKDLGFLPGDLNEKMEPWIAPMKDNLNFLLGMDKKQKCAKTNEGSSKFSKHDTRYENDSSYLSLMRERGLIEIEAITFIRGRSIPDAFMLVDETQNSSIHEIKTILTRVGEGTKIVLLGDIEQIDNMHVDRFTNGLTYAIEKFKDQPIAGHVTLLKGERSQLSAIASKIL
jgi:PhoH-like ATPase